MWTQHEFQETPLNPPRFRADKPPLQAGEDLGAVVAHQHGVLDVGGQ